MSFIEKERRVQIGMELSEDVSKYPRDIGYNVDSKIVKNGWNRCNDGDIISSIFREWREEANRLHFALRRDTEAILRIDIKGDEISEEDRRIRSIFIDNIETIVGKGNGEAWLGRDPELRWSKLLDYLETEKKFPREKVGLYHNVYTTVSHDGHLALQQKSIDRAHNQVRNQNRKNVEIFVDMPKMAESQLWTYLGQNARHIELLKQSMTLHRIQENVIIKRLAEVRKSDDIKKLFSPDMSKPFDFIDVDDIVNRKGDI